MQRKEDRKCSKTDTWSVRGINERDIDLRVGYEMPYSRRIVSCEIGKSLAPRQLSHLSGESSRCGDNVGLETSSGTQQVV